jgi:biuret amidohydrolase
MRGANDRGHDCLLVEEATENYFSEFKRSTLDMIRAQGAIVGWTAVLESVETVFEAVCWDLGQPGRLFRGAVKQLD